MLTIKKTDDIPAVARFLGDAMPSAPETCIFMACADGTGIAAVGWLCLKDSRVYLAGAKCADGMDMLLHGLGKSLLNLADLRGIQTIYGDAPALEPLYHMLGFRQTDGEWELSLAGYFTHGC